MRTKATRKASRARRQGGRPHAITVLYFARRKALTAAVFHRVHWKRAQHPSCDYSYLPQGPLEKRVQHTSCRDTWPQKSNSSTPLNRAPSQTLTLTYSSNAGILPFVSSAVSPNHFLEYLVPWYVVFMVSFKLYWLKRLEFVDCTSVPEVTFILETLQQCLVPRREREHARRHVLLVRTALVEKERKPRQYVLRAYE